LNLLPEMLSQPHPDQRAGVTVELTGASEHKAHHKHPKVQTGVEGFRAPRRGGGAGEYFGGSLVQDCRYACLPIKPWAGTKESHRGSSRRRTEDDVAPTALGAVSRRRTRPTGSAPGWPRSATAIWPFGLLASMNQQGTSALARAIHRRHVSGLRRISATCRLLGIRV
jgi:hypothetical protein